MKKQKQLWFLPMIMMFVAFLIIPLGFMIVGSFRSDITNQWTISNYQAALSNPYYTQAFVNSIKIACISSITGILFSLLLCFCLLSLSEKAQEKITLITNLAGNFAGIPLAFSFIVLVGNAGVLKMLIPSIASFDLYSISGLILTYLYFQIPLGVLFLYPSLKEVKQEWLEAANILGANTFYSWRKIVWPFLLPALASTFAILFANAMGTYETAYALIGSNVNLLTIRIAALVSGDVFAKPNMGSALATLFGLILILMMFLVQRKGKVRR